MEQRSFIYLRFNFIAISFRFAFRYTSFFKRFFYFTLPLLCFLLSSEEVSERFIAFLNFLNSFFFERTVTDTYKGKKYVLLIHT